MIGAILDHLWQSTLLALAVGLLMLALRRTRASVRHALWFAASVKFLVPFAALEALGRLLAPMALPPVVATPGIALIAHAARPFSQSNSATSAIDSAPALHAAPGLDPGLLLLAVWGLGCAAVLLVWMARWAKVRSAVQTATPLPWRAPMPVLASPSMMEPGLVGLWRPVVIVPENLPDHLAQAEIDALVAHEACHLRRHDNLTAAIHMLVEALFWFHPLVWWMGVRMIEERERACDEAVVRLGHDRAAYARSLVECCRLYLQSPLSCVAGASGSVLKTRVARIMTAPPSKPLSAPARALLLAAGLCALASPVMAGLLTSPAGRVSAPLGVVGMSAFAPASEDARPDDASAPGPAARKVSVKTFKTPGSGQADSAASDAMSDDAAARPAPLALQAEPAPRLVPSALSAVALVATPATLNTTAIAPPQVEVSRGVESAEDPDRPVCTTETMTGSRFVRRLCRTTRDREEDQRQLYAFERRQSIDPSGSPAVSHQAAADAESQ